MAELDPVFLIEAEALADIVDELDYFQILKIEPTAGPVDVKAAYFRESRRCHPDQYYRMDEGDTKKAIGKVYKRLNEAWVVLRDDARRTKYIADIAGPDRDKKLRFNDASEEEMKKQRDAELGTTVQGRRTFQQGLIELEGGRYAQAYQNFKLAFQFEPKNVLFKQKLDEAAKLAGVKK